MNERKQKILHISLIGPVTDNWIYQDNILAKYHHKLGNSVSMITSTYIYNNEGILTVDDRTEYLNEFGIKTYRLSIKHEKSFSNKFKIYNNLYGTIEKEQPDIVFVHGCQFVDTREIARYLKKKPQVKLFVDNHADFSNSATSFLSKNVLHKIIWKHYAQKIEPFTAKFYGVLPARVDFLHDIYGIPHEKIDLLFLGADDDLVVEVKEDGSKNDIRRQFDIEPEDLLIVTGGKIDSAKYQTLFLMEAINSIQDQRLKLIVFGSVDVTLQERFNDLLSDRVFYAGWQDSKGSYSHFNAADLVIFPGRHSVYWEVVVALGIPMIVKHYKGMTHVDLGGNCKFLYEDSVDEIRENLLIVLQNEQNFQDMRIAALSDRKSKFLYSAIAEQSLAP